MCTHTPPSSGLVKHTVRLGTVPPTRSWPDVPSWAEPAAHGHTSHALHLTRSSDSGSDSGSHHRGSFVHASTQPIAPHTTDCYGAGAAAGCAGCGPSYLYCPALPCPARHCWAPLGIHHSLQRSLAHSEVLMRLQSLHWHPSSPSVPLLQTQIPNSISFAVICDPSHLRGPISTTRPPLRISGGPARPKQPRKLHLPSGPLFNSSPRSNPAFLLACSPPVAAVSSRGRQR